MFYHTILTTLRANRDQIAFSDANGEETYGQMLSHTAWYFERLNMLPTGSPIVLYGHKEPFLRHAMLACILAGMPYVPIDSATPDGRVREILRQVRPALAIGRGAEDWPCLCMLPSGAYGDADVLFARERPADLVCYILFTSGSAGSPKGVCVSYANVDTCVRWLCTLFSERPSCVLNQANYSFDLSVADLFLSLLYAAKHVPLDRDVLRDFPKLFAWLRDSGADAAVWTPSFAQLLLRDRSFTSALMPRLRTILFCGETLPPATAQQLLARFPDVRIWNCYGPTECTFAVTAARITAREAAQPVLPVGCAKPGVRVDVADGEVCICGDSVAKGYLPPTASDAFYETPDGRAYRTGDRGVLRDGVLYITGRLDRQIKLGGYRVEPAEAEQALLRLPHVLAAVATPRLRPDGVPVGLQAFVVTDDADCRASSLRAALETVLPGYMLPRICIVPQIPMTENGKADVQALWDRIREGQNG